MLPCPRSFPFRRDIVPAFVISQVVPKENLAADPMRRIRYGKDNDPHLLTGMGSRVNLVPVVGIELTTYRLQGGCSTTELNRHKLIIPS